MVAVQLHLQLAVLAVVGHQMVHLRAEAQEQQAKETLVATAQTQVSFMQQAVVVVLLRVVQTAAHQEQQVVMAVTEQHHQLLVHL